MSPPAPLPTASERPGVRGRVQNKRARRSAGLGLPRTPPRPGPLAPAAGGGRSPGPLDLRGDRPARALGRAGREGCGPGARAGGHLCAGRALRAGRALQPRPARRSGRPWPRAGPETPPTPSARFGHVPGAQGPGPGAGAYGPDAQGEAGAVRWDLPGPSLRSAPEPGSERVSPMPPRAPHPGGGEASVRGWRFWEKPALGRLWLGVSISRAAEMLQARVSASACRAAPSPDPA